MNEPWNQKLFDEFRTVRDAMRDAKREKDHSQVITLGRRIVQIDQEMPGLGIALGIFMRDMGDAYVELGQKADAMVYYRGAVSAFKKAKKAKPDDWEKDIARLEKKMQGLA